MEKLWFYAPAGSQEKKGPVPEAEIRALLASGQLHPSDMVWTDGMANWIPIAGLPDFGPPAPELVRPLPGLPAGLLGWMGFVGVMSIVSGIINCLTCFGAVTGIFMIISGTAILGAKTALESVETVDASLAVFFDKLKTFMHMSGIIYILAIVLMVVGLLCYFAFFAAAAARLIGHS